MRYSAISIILLFALSSLSSHAQVYPWLDSFDSSSTIDATIPTPDGFYRPKAPDGSFEEWLRKLPIGTNSDSVFIYNGQPKRNQNVHHAIIEIDIGQSDLMQCADTYIRFLAEYYYSKNVYDSIAFNFTNGDRLSFRDWINGVRPVVNGNNVSWKNINRVDSSYKHFKEYLDTIYMYAGSYSLNHEMIAVDDINDISNGDVFIQGGFPGHVVIVADVAVHKETGKKIFLLVQGFTPAQDVHVLKNPNDQTLSPWYKCNFGETLITPEWRFKKSELKRF